MHPNSGQNVEILQPSPPSELAANAGLAKRFDWTPGGRELGGGSRQPGCAHQAGIEPGREAREIRMSNHWAAGLRSGLLPRIVELQCQKSCQKKSMFLEVGEDFLIFGYVR